MKIDCEKYAKIFKAIGHPIRLRIIAGLMSKDECNVGNMVSKLRLPQSTVSLHLIRLKHAGIVTCKRKATNVCYSICDKNIKKIIKMLWEEK